MYCLTLLKTELYQKKYKNIKKGNDNRDIDLRQIPGGNFFFLCLPNRIQKFPGEIFVSTFFHFADRQHTKPPRSRGGDPGPEINRIHIGGISQKRPDPNPTGNTPFIRVRIQTHQKPGFVSELKKMILVFLSILDFKIMILVGRYRSIIEELEQNLDAKIGSGFELFLVDRNPWFRIHILKSKRPQTGY